MEMLRFIVAARGGMDYMLGRRLTELRKEKKLTQIEIADKLHMSRSTYAQYEVDRRVPEYATLEKMAIFFDVSIDYLVGRVKDRNAIVPSGTNDAQTTIKLIEDEARKLGLSPTDPAFKKMLSDAFDLLRLARGKNND